MSAYDPVWPYRVINHRNGETIQLLPTKAKAIKYAKAQSYGPGACIDLRHGPYLIGRYVDGQNIAR